MIVLRLFWFFTHKVFEVLKIELTLDTLIHNVPQLEYSNDIQLSIFVSFCYNLRRCDSYFIEKQHVSISEK